MYKNKSLKLELLTLDELILAKRIGGFATKLGLIIEIFYHKKKVIKHLYRLDSICRTGTLKGVCQLLFDEYSNNNWYRVSIFQSVKNKRVNENILRISLEGYIRCNDKRFKVEFFYVLNKINKPIDLVAKDFIKLCTKKIKQQNPNLENYLLDDECWCFFHKIIVKII